MPNIFDSFNSSSLIPATPSPFPNPQQKRTGIPSRASVPPLIIPNAHVTAFGYGTDNAYKGHPNGGADVAFSSDPSRPKINHNSQAHLGIGTFEDPSSAAVHPQSDIPMGSKMYVDGKGWFVAEDYTPNYLPKNTIDMWTGHSTDRQQKALTPKSANVTVYWPGADVPQHDAAKGPSGEWLRHYAQMVDQGHHH